MVSFIYHYCIHHYDYLTPSYCILSLCTVSPQFTISSLSHSLPLSLFLPHTHTTHLIIFLLRLCRASTKIGTRRGRKTSVSSAHARYTKGGVSRRLLSDSKCLAFLPSVASKHRPISSSTCSIATGLPKRPSSITRYSTALTRTSREIKLSRSRACAQLFNY